MSTFEDSFLAELDELSDDETKLEENDAQEEEEEEDKIIMTTLDDDDFDSVSKLQKTQKFSDIMQKVEEALDFDYEYKLIVDCNKLLVRIDKEIAILQKFIRHNYGLYLTQSIIINEASSTCGKPLPKDVLEKTIEASDRVLDLDSSKKKVLVFVEIKTRSIAPNLSAIVGSKVATNLMVSAGGLSALAKMPPTCNVQRVGHKRQKTFVGSLVGFLDETDIVQNTPSEYFIDACELLAAKLTLAAGVDSTRGESSGATGRAMRDEVLEEIDKLQEPKPLTVSDTTLKGHLGQLSPQSLELSNGTQSKYFSKFGTLFNIKKF